MKTLSVLSGLLCLACLFSCTHNPTQAKVPVGHGGTLAQFDFNNANAWPQKAAFSSPGTAATLKTGNYGTVDTANSTQPSGGLMLSAQGLKGSGSTGFVSGKLPVANREASLGKLTLAFSLSASSARPVTVTVESFNAKKQRTGGLTAQIYPAAPNFYQRYALDLSVHESQRAGRFALPTHSCSSALSGRQRRARHSTACSWTTWTMPLRLLRQPARAMKQ